MSPIPQPDFFQQEITFVDVFKQHCVLLSVLVKKMVNIFYLGDQVISSPLSALQQYFPST